MIVIRYSETTKDVVLESAYFHPTWIRKSARRHGLSTDASYRFERGVDPRTDLCFEAGCHPLQAVGWRQDFHADQGCISRANTGFPCSLELRVCASPHR